MNKTQWYRLVITGLLLVCCLTVSSYLLGCNQMLIANQGAGENAVGELTPQSPRVNTSATMQLTVPVAPIR